jgi:deoxynucleoside triphosphate triphosphohydrolase SAMHD1
MSKIIFDIIHGFIELDEISISIIDTPEFQRLRNIKQLGAVHYVFPSANHTRFEHSLGVYYLAGELINNLKKNQPELNITNNEILLIKIAGLCHDLGHGPFSHLLDCILEEKSENKLVLHERRSILILKYIVEKYNLNLSNEDLEFIGGIIYPYDLDFKKIKRKFLYEIVSNRTNGIDVDKFDYLKRDTFYLGMSFSLDCSRIIKHVRVIDDSLCYLDKSYYHILEMFEIRNKLHKQVYKHKTVVGIEINISKSIELIKDLENKIFEPKSFCIYDDYNFLKEYNINKRKIYKMIYESKEITNLFGEIKKLKFGYNHNPFNNIYFYNRNNINYKINILKDNLDNSEIIYRVYHF